MVALTRFQGRADEAEVIPSEKIGSFIAGYEFAPRVGITLAWGKPGQGSVPQTFPRWDAMAGGVPSAKAETDEFEERDIAMSESLITPAMFGFAIKRSDEANREAPGNVQAGMMVEALEYLWDSINTNVEGSMTSITASEGAVTDTYNLARYRADQYAYKLLNVGRASLGHVAVVTPTMGQQLTTDLHTSGATLVTGAGDTLALGPESGFIGSLYRMGVYDSQSLPDSGAGSAGGMFPAGQGTSPLGIVVTELPNVETTRGDNMALRAATQHVLRCWYGVGVTNPRKGQQILGAS